MVFVPVAAQAQAERYRVRVQENFRKDPGPDGRLLAVVRPSAEVSVVGRRGKWMEVVLEGWIWSRSVARTSQDGHNLTVTQRGGENLRAAPNGDVVGLLERGTLLNELQRRGNWVHVRRTAWMWGGSLSPLSSTSPGPGGEGTAGASSRRALVAEGTVILNGPGGDTTGALTRDQPVEVLDRSGDWVRVRMDGWVEAAQLRSQDGNVLTGVRGAEVRANPRGYVGRMVEWEVQLVSIQTADELRQEMRPGERYMLARGPLPEYGFIYVVLNREQEREVSKLQPLARLVILSRIRAGRSRFSENPVVELIEMSVKKN